MEVRIKNEGKILSRGWPYKGEALFVWGYRKKSTKCMQKDTSNYPPIKSGVGGGRSGDPKRVQNWDHSSWVAWAGDAFKDYKE